MHQYGAKPALNAPKSILSAKAQTKICTVEETRKPMKPLKSARLILLAALLAPVVVAADTIDGVNTGWMITATALVLFMTLPGLSLFMAAWCAVKTC